MTTHIYEGKTYEEALEKGLQELNCNTQEVYIVKEETEAKLFKAKKVIVTLILKEDIKKYIKKFLKDVTEMMGITVEVEVIENEDIYNITLVSDQNNILIGKEGRTLNSLQLLLRQALNSKVKMNLKVNIDASNYKAKKVSYLERNAKKIIREVQKTHVDVKLDPMNSYERRIIHTLATNFKNIKTESVGESPNRAVLTKYVEE